MTDMKAGANAVLKTRSMQGKKVNDGIKKEIIAYRTKGYGYKRISKFTGINENSMNRF